MQFQTHYNRPVKTPEPGGGPILIEKAGYITAQQRIENMILAGHRLKDYRAEQYDFSDPTKIDENFMDPTRSKNFDMADASQIDFALRQRFKDSDNLPNTITGNTEPSQTALEPPKEV